MMQSEELPFTSKFLSLHSNPPVKNFPLQEHARSITLVNGFKLLQSQNQIFPSLTLDSMRALDQGTFLSFI